MTQTTRVARNIKMGCQRPKKRSWAVDFELAGTVIVEAVDEDEAKKVAAEVSDNKLLELVENFHFGRNYVELMEEDNNCTQK